MHPSPLWEIGESEHCVFEPWSSQTNDFKMYARHFLARRSALLGQGKDNVTELDISSWC